MSLVRSCMVLVCFAVASIAQAESVQAHITALYAGNMPSAFSFSIDQPLTSATQCSVGKWLDVSFSNVDNAKACYATALAAMLANKPVYVGFLQVGADNRCKVTTCYIYQ